MIKRLPGLTHWCLAHTSDVSHVMSKHWQQIQNNANWVSLFQNQLFICDRLCTVVGWWVCEEFGIMWLQVD